MQRTAPITQASALLLGISLIVATVGRAELLEACVCVVNALARGMLALGFSLLLGLVNTVFSRPEGTTLPRVLLVLQVLSFASALFFLIHYAYLLLEVVR